MILLVSRLQPIGVCLLPVHVIQLFLKENISKALQNAKRLAVNTKNHKAFSPKPLMILI